MPREEFGDEFELARYRLGVAKEDLETALDNQRSNHLRAANNRAYYAIYHAITAVLALRQIAFKMHKDTVAYFNKEYIRTEIFPKEMGHRISRAEEIRHDSDYDEFYIASKDETEKQIACAAELIRMVEKYISGADSK